MVAVVREAEESSRSFAEKMRSLCVSGARDSCRLFKRSSFPKANLRPVPSDRRRELLERSAEGRLLLEVSALSPLEFVLREFEHPVIQAGLLFFNGLREVDLRCKGFGHHIPSLLASTGKAQMCRGGSAALARALVAAVRESGGDVEVQVRAEEDPRRKWPSRCESRLSREIFFARDTLWRRDSIRNRRFWS